ncbi:putative transposase [Klebsiella pneumoniae subsp. pneumoniae Kp13]|nr:putative transposase [Klebsiella pneumoniae subsp. pneumoniae Kp13]
MTKVERKRDITGRWLAEFNNERHTHEYRNNLTPEDCRVFADNPQTSKKCRI